jgi:O-antigen ligase
VLAGALLLGAVAIDGARFWETRNRSRAAVSPLDPLWRWVATAAIAGDESVCERLNRWRCAVAMAADRPTTGFGPGSFEPSYGPYQRPDDLTRISTFTGDRGDAHSQLLGTLAEQGLIGLGLELSLAGAALLCGLRAAARATDRQRLATAAAWTGAIAGLTAAGLFAGWSDLPATGPAAFLAMAVLVRLDLGDPR